MQEIVTIIAAWAPAAILVFVRIGGVAIFGPGLSSPALPARFRVTIALLLGLAIFPALASRGVATLDPPLQLDPLALAPLVCMEIALGAAIGFLAGLPLVAAHGGGVLAGQQMGLGFAQLFNPALDDDSDLLGQLFFYFALATFLLIGGLEHMVLAVMHSFDYVPLGGFEPGLDLADVLCGMLLASLELALRIAAPVLALMFLETIAAGFIARTAPQFNILSVGFPLRIVAALLVLMLGLVVMHEVLVEGMGAMLDSIHLWATGGS